MSHGIDIPVDAAANASSDDMAVALYDELRRLARREQAGRPDTIQTTAVLHEAYIRLQKSAGWMSREHFFGAAVTTMRHILIDAARAPRPNVRSRTS